MVVGLIAGGDRAFVKAVEGAEDSEALALEELKALPLNGRDVVIGIAASGRTDVYKRQDQHRCKIVAQGGQRHAGVFVSLEKQNPVHAHGRP